MDFSSSSPTTSPSSSAKLRCDPDGAGVCPCPRRSTANTRNSETSPGITAFQRVWSAPSPCSSSRAGPRPSSLVWSVVGGSASSAILHRPRVGIYLRLRPAAARSTPKYTGRGGLLTNGARRDADEWGHRLTGRNPLYAPARARNRRRAHGQSAVHGRLPAGEGRRSSESTAGTLRPTHPPLRRTARLHPDDPDAEHRSTRRLCPLSSVHVAVRRTDRRTRGRHLSRDRGGPWAGRVSDALQHAQRNGFGTTPHRSSPDRIRQARDRGRREGDRHLRDLYAPRGVLPGGAGQARHPVEPRPDPPGRRASGRRTDHRRLRSKGRNPLARALADDPSGRSLERVSDQIGKPTRAQGPTTNGQRANASALPSAAPSRIVPR